MKDDKTAYDLDSDPMDDSNLIKIFDFQIEETISDEQAGRVLAPVLAMIMEGKYDRNRRMVRIAPLATVAAILAIVVAAAATSLVRNGMGSNVYIDIPENNPPLAAMVLSESALSGYVTLEDEGVAGVLLSLIDFYSSEIVKTAITDSSGFYEFPDAQAGQYKLKITPPSGMSIDATENEAGWVVADGKMELIVVCDDGDLSNSVDIKLCVE